MIMHGYSFYRTYSFYNTCSFYSTLIAKLFLLQNLFLLQYLFILQYLDSQILMDEYQSNFDLDEEITSTRFKFNDMDVEQKPENPLKQVNTSFPSSIKIFTNSKPLQTLSENTRCANAKKHTAGSSDKNIVIHSCNYDRQKDSFRPLLNTNQLQKRYYQRILLQKRTMYSTVLYYHMEIILGH
ncbi:unnamed protein product [Gordionus sp. m RMFG-2023]